MLIEASIPLTIRRRSGDVRLLPGQPVDFPEDEALKLLAKAPGKVREVMTNWLAAWRELAQATYGITPEDSRLRPVLAALDQCDHAFAADDWPAFQRAAVKVKQIIARG